MNYRKDIQILRGVSVLFVVLFHLGFTLFQSGFLGVDVFFVISGFLMAILYRHDNKKSFLMRRAKRLLPAYFVVTLLSIMMAIFLITPNEYNQVFTQSIYASTFSSNIGFWLQNSYFSKVDFNPLLHLWSLGVEIQFYLIIPLLVFFFRLHRYLFFLIFLSSLLLCFTLLGISPKTSFFMMPLRIWEFLIGYGVAQYLTNMGNVHQDKYRYLGTIGFVIILFIPLIHLDGKAMHYVEGHPGLYALLISLATGLVLTFGLLRLIEHSMFGRMLEKLGEYSYSIYLVHFPLITFYLYEPFSGTILNPDKLIDRSILFGLIVVLSTLLYHVVEVGSKKIKNLLLILSLAPLLIVSMAFGGLEIQKSLYTQKELLITNAFKDRDVYRCGKLKRILEPSSKYCKITEFSSSLVEQRMMLIGNSHADSIKYVFAREAEKLNTELFFIVSNEPMFKGKITAKEIIEDALKYNIDSIVLHYSFSKLPQFLKNIEALTALAFKHDITVDFIMPMPYWDRDIPKALWVHSHQDVPLPLKTKEAYVKRNKENLNFLSKITFTNFKIYATADILCNEECLYIDAEGKPLYFDSGHLTLTGSKYFALLFHQIIEHHLSK